MRFSHYVVESKMTKYPINQKLEATYLNRLFAPKREYSIQSTARFGVTNRTNRLQVIEK